jgi:phage tail protein X
MKTLIAIDGERWDSACLRAYGKTSPEMVKQLRNANRSIAQQNSFTLDAGQCLQLPVVDVQKEQMKTIGLAPWQR